MSKPPRGVAAASLLLASCGGGIAPAIGNASAESAATARATAPAQVGRSGIERWDATRCGDDDYRNARMERHPALMGRAPEALEAAFGPVGTRESFRVGGPAGTFYGELGRRRSGPPRRHDGARAQVLTWTRQACNFSVFFVEKDGAWRAVNAFEWAVGADF
ncbi:hypothetical protein [Sphingomonas sp.]|jgi:hypothetical protein|uniref:hypothetical protein n=1 Tax=Sphingomonas sp. TaxID=28214 RepID=UPI002D7FA200|nr:hypothetical protein [Sphingomonas sp.]HEU0043387.1 hypothetical protein [Sphingomonas sp.]